MAPEHPNPRLHNVPPELMAWIRDVFHRRGSKGAARVLGISRSALFGVLARGTAMPGTIALLRLALERKEAA